MAHNELSVDTNVQYPFSYRLSTKQ